MKKFIVYLGVNLLLTGEVEGERRRSSWDFGVTAAAAAAAALFAAETRLLLPADIEDGKRTLVLAKAVGLL